MTLRTPSQTIGPFFHVGLKWEEGAKVVFPVAGERIVLTGRLYDGAGWFKLGNKVLATHLYRTDRLAQGAMLSTVTAPGLEAVAACNDHPKRAQQNHGSNQYRRTTLHCLSARQYPERFGSFFETCAGVDCWVLTLMSVKVRSTP